MDSPAPLATPSGSSPGLIGRDQGQGGLRAAYAAALAGRGSLVLIGGEAGIGKTALAEALCIEAAAQGTLVLAGYCHDLAETPPYGPWAELLAAAPSELDIPAPPDLGGNTVPASQAALFAQVREYLAALAAHRPVVLLLEDLHWADPASLDLLRALASSLDTLPLLLLATYRPEDLARDHPLEALLPALVRERRPLRLDLRPLGDDAMRTLVDSRYSLPTPDTTRLVNWLQDRAEGNPFYALELLQGIEEEGLLQRVADSWVLGDLARASLPPLLRQVIDRRIARLGMEARRTLAVAAVIGQEVPLSLWTEVSQAEEDALLAVVEAAEAAHLLVVTGDGSTVHFAHALIREALYVGTSLVQRRAWHRQIGNTLAGLPGPDPDTVAYHFQRGDDPRAIEWLLRAATRAERAFAWQIAAERCTAALMLEERRGVAMVERAWLGYRIAALRRYRDPRGALTMLEEVARLATDAGDRVLDACVLFLRGNLHCYVGEFGPGLDALVDGTATLDALVGEERERLGSLGAIAGFTLDARQQRATLVMRLAGTGRFAEASQVGEPLLRSLREAQTARDGGNLAEANAARGLAIAHAALGQPDEARREFARARSIFQRLGDHFHVGVVATQELQWIALPYRADRPAERVHLAALAEQAWVRAGTAMADLPARFARLPLLLLEGDWAAARELALMVHASGSSYKATATRALARLAREQGDPGLARRLIQDELPAGPDTPIGTVNFSTVLLIQRLAAAQALEDGDPREAREWLSAHDGWLARSGAILGRAEGQLGWATYHRAVGSHALARQRAEDALGHANEPRQPLALLVAHRLRGELDTVARRYAEAEAHLEQAMELADACAVRYERALTLLAMAELRLAMGERGAAHAFVDEAHGICGSLNARPALARADALAARLVHASTHRCDDPAGLSAREMEVLRFVAAGQSNREIAASLVLSERTVEKHIAHVYAKIGARGRADAVAYAVRRGLLPESGAHPHSRNT